MPEPSEQDLFEADLEDDLFVCYVVVGTEASEAWKVAKRAFSFVPMVNIYRFDDHTALKAHVGNSKPVGTSFSAAGRLVEKLSQSKAEDLDAVLSAMEAALRAEP